MTPGNDSTVDKPTMLRNEISQIKTVPGGTRSGMPLSRQAGRTCADFPIAVDLHAHQCVLDAGYRLSSSKHDAVIYERGSSLDSHHIFGKLFCLDIVAQHFVTLVQENCYVVSDAAPFWAGRPAASRSSSS